MNESLIEMMESEFSDAKKHNCEACQLILARLIKKAREREPVSVSLEDSFQIIIKTTGGVKDGLRALFDKMGLSYAD